MKTKRKQPTQVQLDRVEDITDEVKRQAEDGRQNIDGALEIKDINHLFKVLPRNKYDNFMRAYNNALNGIMLLDSQMEDMERWLSDQETNVK